jgi:hypothetical protein
MPVEFIGMISTRDQSERVGGKHADAYALGGEPLAESAGVAA